MKRPYRNILNSVARQSVPDEINLYPRIIAQLERKPFMQALHARPAITIILLLLSLTLLSGVVYAVGRSLGYIPGVGIVEQDMPIRVLAQPIEAERDGITLTVTDAVLTSEKTIVLYTLEDVPWDIYSPTRKMCPAVLRCHSCAFPMATCLFPPRAEVTRIKYEVNFHLFQLE